MIKKLCILTLITSLSMACGTDGGDDPTGDGRRLNELGPEEQKALCDWYAAQWGGYGKVRSCGEGVTVSGPTPEDCLSGPNKCTATVAEAKACMKGIVRDACKETFEAPPECRKLPASCQ